MPPERRASDPIAEDIHEIKRDVQRIYLALFGNGHPGLKTIVDRHDQSFRLMVWVIAPLYAAAVAVVANAMLR